MNASDQDDESEDVSDEQITAVRRGEPVSVTGYRTSSDDESDGPLPLLLRKNESALFYHQRYFEINHLS